MPQIVPSVEPFARIKVVSVGGGGGKSIDRMIDSGVRDVDFIVINTDAQALHNSKAPTKLHIGKETTRGLGAGADPSVGRASAEESREEIKQILEGADMVFVVVTEGGGTGSGGAPVVAEVAQELDILTVGFATKPFSFEGERRRRNAETGIANLRENVDTLITIPNDRILQTVDRKTPLLEAFGVVDDVLRQGVQGISDLITVDGLINLDFADVKTIMNDAGSALMGIGRARGDDRAIRAAKEAIESPLLEVSIDGARGVLFSVSGGADMAMHEINEAAETITAAVDPEANVIFGANVDEALEGEMRITVIATGFDAAYNVEQTETSGEGLAYFSKPAEGEEGAASSHIILDNEAKLTEEPIELNEDKKPVDQETETPADVWNFTDDEEDWDAPAFLRNKDKPKKKESKPASKLTERFKRHTKTDDKSDDKDDKKDDK